MYLSRGTAKKKPPTKAVLISILILLCKESQIKKHPKRGFFDNKMLNVFIGKKPGCIFPYD